MLFRQSVHRARDPALEDRHPHTNSTSTSKTRAQRLMVLIVPTPQPAKVSALRYDFASRSSEFWSSLRGMMLRCLITTALDCAKMTCLISIPLSMIVIFVPYARFGVSWIIGTWKNLRPLCEEWLSLCFWSLVSCLIVNSTSLLSHSAFSFKHLYLQVWLLFLGWNFCVMDNENVKESFGALFILDAFVWGMALFVPLLPCLFIPLSILHPSPVIPLSLSSTSIYKYPQHLL